MDRLQVHQFICRTDNFGLLLHDPASNQTASIDTPDAVAISRELAERNWRLTHIFNTHHHYDHVPGNEPLKSQTGCTIIGAACDAARIPLIDVALADGEDYQFAAQPIRLIETPGHTRGSVCYHLPRAGLLFTGDTLFSLGCGRLFEGTAEEMWASLRRLRELPGDPLIHCGHEYTLGNAEFALEMEPGNAALQARAAQVRQLRRQRLASLPVSLASERACNPFLRPDSAEIRARLGMQAASDIDVFTRLRELKNQF